MKEIPGTNPIRYRRLAGWKYEVDKDVLFLVPILPERDIKTEYITLTARGEFYILHGYAWDGPSGPTVDSLCSMRGSLAHDALYQLMRLGLLEEKWRPVADEILEKLCLQDGMVPVRAGLWRRAVNWFAGGCAKPGSEKQDEQSIVLEAP